MPESNRSWIGRLLFKDASPDGAKARTTEDGDRIVEFAPPLAEYIRLYGSWSSYGGMYRTQPAVRTVIDFLARNMAELNLSTFEHVPEDGSNLKLDDHAVSQLLRRPSGPAVPGSASVMTRYRHMFATVADLAIYDRAYWLKLRDQRSVVRAIARVPVTKIWPEYDARTNVLLYYRTSSGEIIMPTELVVFPGYHPDSNVGSVSPLETLRRILAEEWASGLNREYFWKHAARIEGVIERPLDAPDWSETARTRFREDWEGVMTGAQNAGRTAVLEEGMKFKDQSFSPKDSQYLEGRKLAREEVARSYGIAPTLVGILDHATFSNVEAQHTHAYQDVFGPWCRRIQDEIDVQLLPEYEGFDSQSRQFTAFNLDSKLKGSFTEEAELLTSASGGPWMTRKEARIRKNLPVDEASMAELVTPMNVAIGGGPQPAPNIPTEVPKARTRGEKRLPVNELDQIRAEFAADTERTLKRFFERQRQVLKSRAGAKTKPLFQADRWNRELSEELFATSFTASKFVGEFTAKQVNAEYDGERTRAYWEQDASFSAENINNTTRALIVDSDEIDAVFAKRINDASAMATQRVTRAVNWSILEAARQASE